MATAIPTQMEKCKGAMIATAIGDALGWPNEFRANNTVRSTIMHDYFVEWTRRSGRPFWHNEVILAGEYSDDTQMTLAVARSIISGNWEETLFKKELPFWLKYERGGGKALLKAADSCKKGILLWESNNKKDYFNAGGNGAVMRILPHVIAAARSVDTNSLIINVVKDSILTHGHPRAILGATCYAYALNYLLRKENVLEYGELVSAIIDGKDVWGTFPNSTIFTSWRDIATHQADFDYIHEWNAVVLKMINQLEYIKAALKKGLMQDDNNVLTQLECYSKANGAGDVAILAAIYLCSKYANNPTLGIKVPAFSFGTDTDTIASVTGGLLGMLCGINWIPTEWKLVQDYACLNQITELLLIERSKEAAMAIANVVKEQSGEWDSTPIGSIRRLSSSTLESGKNNQVVIAKWQTALGQTIYFKDYKRNESDPKILERQMQLPLEPSNNKINTQTAAPAPTGKSVSLQDTHRQFVLSASDVNALLNEPLLKKKTFIKVIQIVKSVIASKDSSAVIAKKLKVEQTVVDLIRTYVR